MNLALDPRRYDVVVTENLFGDILSDEAGAIAGSLGMLPSASLGDGPGLYEPIHGSAPTLAGRNVANPIGTIGSVALMLRHAFSLETEARAIETAIEGVARSRPPHRRHCAPRRSHGVLLGHGRRDRRPHPVAPERLPMLLPHALPMSLPDPLRRPANVAESATEAAMLSSRRLLGRARAGRAGALRHPALAAAPLRRLQRALRSGGHVQPRRPGLAEARRHLEVPASRDRAADRRRRRRTAPRPARYRVEATAGGDLTFAADRGSTAGPRG